MCGNRNLVFPRSKPVLIYDEPRYALEDIFLICVAFSPFLPVCPCLLFYNILEKTYICSCF